MALVYLENKQLMVLTAIMVIGKLKKVVCPKNYLFSCTMSNIGCLVVTLDNQLLFVIDDCTVIVCAGTLIHCRVNASLHVIFRTSTWLFQLLLEVAKQCSSNYAS